jgi:hypothetical protein
MNSLDGVSGRIAAIYKKHYESREPLRALNLYKIFESMALAVEKTGGPYRLNMDYIRLGELVRSYFLDAIRYKEYHFNPDAENVDFREKVKKLGFDDFSQIEPLSEAWTYLVHETANINSSKVASYTVKWILAYKPISAVNISSEISPTEQSIFFSCVNEYYALNCALFALELDELIYSFRFRKFDEATYFMVLSEDYLLGRPEIK